MTPPPDLSIIIVSYNTRQLLAGCLASVYADLGWGTLVAEVIVVDNASRDGSTAMVRAQFPQVRLIESGANLGYGTGANLGLRAAAGRYLLLLNSDTLVQVGALGELVRFMDAHPDVGAAGPRLLNADGTVQRSAFRFPNLVQIALDLFPLVPRLLDTPLNGRYRQDVADQEQPFTVDFTLGAAFVVSRAAYIATGGFDKDYFMYAEEVDWAMRLRAAGFAYYSVPAAKIVHFAGQSVKQVPRQMFYQLFRSRAILYRKHYPRGFQIAARWLVQVAMVWRATTDWWQYRRGGFDYTELRQRWRTYGKIWREYSSPQPSPDAGGGEK